MTDWQQIVEAHGPLVWRTAQRLLRHESDASDCFQRTFLSALDWTRSRPGEPIRHWPALLKRIATSRALEQLRKRIRENNRFKNHNHRPDHDSISTIDELSDASIQESFEVTSDNELAEQLRSVLATIDERQAEVFCLACLDDCSYQEIAEQLQMTVNHVGVTLNRAKAALREKLKSHDPKQESKTH